MAAAEEANPELVLMTRRFWVCLALTLPVFLLAMSDMIPGQPLQHAFSPRLLSLAQLALASPVVLWGGWPFFERGWASLVNRHLNMFTLIAMGTGTAYVYSLAACSFPAFSRSRFAARAARFPCTSKLGRDHHPGPPGPGAGASRASPDEQRDQSIAGTCAQDRARGARRRRRGGRAARAPGSGRSAARAPWRKGRRRTA